MLNATRSGIQVVPYVGRARSDGPLSAAAPRAGTRPHAAGLRWAALLAVATFLVDLVGASQAHSVSLAISAVQSAGQVLTVGAALLVVRHPSASTAHPPFDPSRVAALAAFLSGLVLLILSVPIAYRALASLCLPGDFDAAESACILILGLCSSAVSLRLILGTDPGIVPRDDEARSEPEEGRHGAFDDLVAGHRIDVQTSAALLAGTLVSALSGWGWVDALAGLAGSFLMSIVAARVVAASGAVLIDARPR